MDDKTNNNTTNAEPRHNNSNNHIRIKNSKPKLVIF
jgi:hypothetical protein